MIVCKKWDVRMVIKQNMKKRDVLNLQRAHMNSMTNCKSVILTTLIFAMQLTPATRIKSKLKRTKNIASGRMDVPHNTKNLWKMGIVHHINHALSFCTAISTIKVKNAKKTPSVKITTSVLKEWNVVRDTKRTRWTTILVTSKAGAITITNTRRVKNTVLRNGTVGTNPKLMQIISNALRNTFVMRIMLYPLAFSLRLLIALSSCRKILHMTTGAVSTLPC